ncbi:MAG: tRNA pseudouridine(38-40) synthase TruA [Candidatus Eremiobacteraeota bacterium]|nr:tRNA pseudouridine(38-40) synthase TruA [Candidatus Eremiobacteraeota bacterium]
MRTLALVVEYDGTLFNGFARQKGVASVAADLEAALRTLLRHDVSLTCAGRTDSGVHATGQVVSCRTSSTVPLWRIPIAGSALLRDSGIAIVKAVERGAAFSARRDALARTYRYRILNRAAPSALWRARALHICACLDIEAMRAGALALLGSHDFSAFCARLGPGALAVRTIESIRIARHGDFIDCAITADSFLHRMVRIVVGTLIEVGRALRPADDIGDILVARDRRRAGFTAPPHGLYLTHVRYDDPV